MFVETFFKLKPFVATLTICWTLSSCSQRLLRVEPLLDLKDTDGLVTLTIDKPLKEVQSKLISYLKKKERLGKVTDATDSTVVLVQNWQRDLSLRYYLLKFDTKTRHVSEWQMSWTLKKKTPQRTQITTKTLEIVFIGSPSNARGGPASKKPKIPHRQNSWFEMPPDRLRSIVETKHFLNTEIPEVELPNWMNDFKTPELKGQTLAIKQELSSKRWKPSVRQTAF